MRFDASMESLINTGRSESFVDLNETDLAQSRNGLNQGRDMFMSYQGKVYANGFNLQNQTDTKFMNSMDKGHGFGAGKGLNDDTVGGPTKQFGLGKLRMIFDFRYSMVMRYFDENLHQEFHENLERKW